ncbi:MAG: autotransporter-associated beta strand repeat-containing protein [Kiritimatiellae bacterium]|nr:autotransporter-associated beta strand repeat-containing protein [Kiritimatiellia bacterium]
MNRILIMACAAATTFSAWATATLNGNILAFNVESGEETYSSTLPSTIDGIVKTGAGTVILTASSTGFTGGKPITISGGAIEIQTANALGSGNTVTVANGATFRMMYSSGNGQANDIVLLGGSTLCLGGGGSSDDFLGNVTLAGNATLDLENRRGFGKTLDLGGYTLTRTGANVEFVFSGNGTAGTTAIVKGPGTIRNAATATITFMGVSTFDADVVFENAANGAVFNMWNRTTPVPCKLKVAENTIFQMGRGLVNGASGTPLANIWDGDVEIAAGKTLNFQGYSSSYAGDYLTVGGVISGDGAVRIMPQANGAIFQFKGDNTYTGGTSIEGNSLRACTDGAVSTAGTVTMMGGELQVSLDEGGCTDAGLDALFANVAYEWVGGRDSYISTYTSTGVDATTAADFSVLHPSIVIDHKGLGKATITGALRGDAILLNDEGTGAYGGNNLRGLWMFLVRGGTMDVVGGSLQRSFYDGNRTYRIGDSNDVANAKMRVKDSGQLYFPNSGDNCEKVYVEDKGSNPSILEIHDSGAVTGVVHVGLAANTSGAIYQYGGTFHNLSTAGRDGWFAREGKAFYGLYDGAFDVDGWLGIAGNTNSVGMVEIEGGTFAVTGGGSPLVVGRSAGRAELYMGGGAMTVANNIVMGGLEYAPDPDVAGGFAVLTLAGTNNPSLAISGQLQMCQRKSGYTSVVNMNAGTLTAPSIQFPEWLSSERVGCKAYVNFNGGTFRPSSTAALSVTGAVAPTRVTVFGKGATIDYNGGNADWNVPFLRPDGRGIKSITIPAAAAVSGYAIPPVVAISGGGGEGATAHVRLDPKTGMIEREIEVTSPGWGFSGTPTVTITAPDMKTEVACTVVLTEDEQEDGGLTKSGTGYLSVYAANSYTGDTVVAGGTFYMQNASAVPPMSSIRLAGGHLATRDFNPVRARLGGYGTFASWDYAYLTITNELRFSAADLAAGRKITCQAGKFSIGADCVLTVDGLDTLQGGNYTLMDATGTGIILGNAPRLVGAETEKWKVTVSVDGKKMTLRRVGMMILIR